MNNQQNFNPYTGQPVNQNVNNGNNFDPNTGRPINQNINNYNQTFTNNVNKKNEIMCEISFWLSIVGLLGSFFGIIMGIFVYIFDFYSALQGLETRKRKKAIATIVMSIISIVFTIINLFL